MHDVAHYSRQLLEGARPRLLMVAHGTQSPDGAATSAAVRDAVAAVRPEVEVDLCFLDVIDPRLPDTLAANTTPTVVVPALLSTGYHVQADIPEAIGARPNTLLARHLGPHPLLVDAVLERLDPVERATTVLVGAGSSRPEARAELLATADLLAERLGTPVRVLTMADDLTAELDALPRPAQAATYLLAEGQFVDTLRAAAAGFARVGAPIGVHPALVELIWMRYDEALAAIAGDPVR